MTTKTEFNFAYKPADFVEAPLTLPLRHGQLTMDNGKAIYVLNAPTNPVPDALRQQISKETSDVFKLRQMIIYKPFKLTGPNVTQFDADGREHKAVFLEGVSVLGLAGNLNMVVTDAKGNVTHDSRAERIQADTASITSILPKMGNSTLQAMVTSYCQAAEDLLRGASSKRLRGPSRAVQCVKRSERPNDPHEGLPRHQHRHNPC